MKPNFNHLALLLLVILISSCNTSQKAFKKGNYYDATLKAVKQLRNNPDSKKAVEVIEKSYPMELEYERQSINQLTTSNHPDKYLNIVETYTRLNNLADEISRCPAALEVVKPVVYFHTQLQKAEELAINEQYEAALRLMDKGNYLDARLAVERLEWVKQKNPAFKNLNDKLAEASNLATLKTVVEWKPEVKTNYDINTRVFYVRMFDFLDKKIGNQFTKFYQPELAEKIKLTPHEIMTIQFLEFQISVLVEREKENKYESDSLVIGSYSDAEGVEHNVFGIVKATVDIYERELMVKGLLEVKVIDYASQEVISSQKFPAEYLWKNDWASYNGDERAVPAQILALTKSKQQVPPPPQEMFLLMSDQLYNNAAQYLRSYYRKKD